MKSNIQMSSIDYKYNNNNKIQHLYSAEYQLNVLARYI